MDATPVRSVNIVTKSGGKYHPRNRPANISATTRWIARNYFDPVGTPRAPFHNNQYGASLGGPIIKDRTFFTSTMKDRRSRWEW